MKTRHGIVVATMVASLALYGPAMAAGGQGKGKVIQKQTGNMNQIQKQQRFRDGSYTQSGTSLGAKNKSGNTYGPGDGTGYQGQEPKDGTGYEPLLTDKTSLRNGRASLSALCRFSIPPFVPSPALPEHPIALIT